jgi:hypothetical protein
MSDRQSYIRVRSGALVSADLTRLTTQVQYLASQVRSGEMSPAHAAGSLEILAQRIAQLSTLAAAVEEHVERLTEEVRCG